MDKKSGVGFVLGVCGGIIFGALIDNMAIGLLLASPSASACSGSARRSPERRRSRLIPDKRTAALQEKKAAESLGGNARKG